MKEKSNKNKAPMDFLGKCMELLQPLGVV